MFKIIGNNIYLSRGDTASPAIKIRSSDGEYYRLGGTDILVFTVKKNLSDTSPALVKNTPREVPESVSSDTIYKYVFDISKNDTMSLDFGDYYYDVRLDYIDNSADPPIVKRCTIVEPSLFKIKEVVSDE